MSAHLIAPDEIDRAAERLRAGGLVAFPTETVYGLGADATNDRAVADIFAAKGRPQFNPLIVHLADFDQARAYVEVSEVAERLAVAFMPGGLTLVLPRKADCALSYLVSAGLDSVALRVPAHPLAQRLIAAAGRPIAAPSANRSGRVSPTTAAHVVEGFTESEFDLLVLDGGHCRVGIESTVVGLTDPEHPTLLRPGAVPREAIESLLDAPLLDPDESDEDAAATPGAAQPSPGRLMSHYAPDALVRLDVTDPEPDEVLLAFGSDVPHGARLTLNLSEDGDLAEAAANLFGLLRVADSAGAGLRIAVMPIPDQGLGAAINDRLRRAAAPRG